LNCKGIIRELTDYLDGDLTPEVRAELEEHLAGCDDCRIVVDSTRKTIEIFCHCKPAPLPEDVRIRLHDAVRRHLSKAPS
jgi:anti-sigma factor RsiW